MKRLRKEIVQAVGASEPFPIFHPLWRLAKIGLDWAPPRPRTGWLFGRVAIAGQSVSRLRERMCLGPGVGARVSWSCLSYTDCGLQGPHRCLSFSRKLAGRRKLDSESQGTCGTPCARPPRGTRESRLWPGTPGARRLLDPSKRETSAALGFGEEGDPRAGTMDRDRSSLGVSEDGITQQPHAFHLELIGKPC